MIKKYFLGLHNTSDDSILTNQSGNIIVDPRGMDPRGSSRIQPSLESLGGSRYMEPVNRSSEPQPMGLPRSHVKLMPGRMSSLSQNSAPAAPQQQRQNNPSSRPQSRAGGRNNGIPFTAV